MAGHRIQRPIHRIQGPGHVHIATSQCPQTVLNSDNNPPSPKHITELSPSLPLGLPPKATQSKSNAEGTTTPQMLKISATYRLPQDPFRFLKPRHPDHTHRHSSTSACAPSHSREGKLCNNLPTIPSSSVPLMPETTQEKPACLTTELILKNWMTEYT